MEEDRDHLGNGSYHQLDMFLGTQQPEGGEEELIKLSCRIALRRLSTSSKLFVDEEEDLGDTTAEHSIDDRASDFLEQGMYFLTQNIFCRKQLICIVVIIKGQQTGPRNT